MSTRSMIGIQNRDGSIDAIWCHWDGYPSNNGRILLDMYTTAKATKELINQGNRESLDNDNNVGFDLKGVPPESKKYHFKNRKDFLAFDGWQEYSYLRAGRRWLYSSNGKTFHQLTRKVCE